MRGTIKKEKEYRKMKRTILTLLVLLVCLTPLCAALSSCSGEAIYGEGDGELRVLCTSFAPFDLAREVGGDRVRVSILQDSGADLHNYTPTAATLDAIAQADLFIYIGGTSDEGWINDAIRASGNKGLTTLCLMDYISPIHAELENDWTDDEHDHHDGEAHESKHSHNDHDHSHGHEGHDHSADEHIWTSVKNAKLMVTAIKDAMTSLDGAGKETYESNCARYISELDRLDGELEAIFDKIPLILFADRFPFVYLLHDYHVPYKAAFSGCSTEVNSGFDTQVKLIESVKDNNLPCIFVIEGGSKDLADAVSAETGCKTYSLNSMQSVKRSDIIAGDTYLSIMQKNIDILKEAHP